VSRDRFTHGANRLQLPMCSRAHTELARIHVFDHALAQRADSIRINRKLLS
jgi:hypothetical protein